MQTNGAMNKKRKLSLLLAGAFVTISLAIGSDDVYAGRAGMVHTAPNPGFEAPPVRCIKDPDAWCKKPENNQKVMHVCIDAFNVSNRNMDIVCIKGKPELQRYYKK